MTLNGYINDFPLYLFLITFHTYPSFKEILAWF